MKQDFDKLFEVIESATKLSNSEIEELVAGLGEGERQVLDSMIATKRALQRNEALKCADSVADEAWKAFERQNFDKNRASEEADSVVSVRPLWLKIAAAVVVVVAISGLTVAAVRGNWLRIDKAETATEQQVNVEEKTGGAYSDSSADSPQVEVLDNVTLDAMLTLMASHYGATVQFADDSLRTIRLYFEWDKSQSLERNVQLLNNFSRVSLSVDNDVITVSNPENDAL